MTTDPLYQVVDWSKISEQTEHYIVLKPLAERFNRIASEITDNEIRNIIKSEIKEQLRKVDFSETVNEIIENYLNENSDDVLSMYKNGLKERLR